jgi:hypothetical protein
MGAVRVRERLVSYREITGPSKRRSGDTAWLLYLIYSRVLFPSAIPTNPAVPAVRTL